MNIWEESVNCGPNNLVFEAIPLAKRWGHKNAALRNFTAGRENMCGVTSGIIMCAKNYLAN